MFSDIHQNDLEVFPIMKIWEVLILIWDKIQKILYHHIRTHDALNTETL